MVLSRFSATFYANKSQNFEFYLWESAGNTDLDDGTIQLFDAGAVDGVLSPFTIILLKTRVNTALSNQSRSLKKYVWQR